MEKTFSFTVNGQPRTVTTDPSGLARSAARGPATDRHQVRLRRRPVRRLHGADQRQARGVVHHAGGNVDKQEILTIEGLAAGDKLHPVQEAFLAEGAFQCGYCTPGMILAVVGLLNEKPDPTDAEILTRMEGHLCRCCGYPKILNAIKRAAALPQGETP